MAQTIEEARQRSHDAGMARIRTAIANADQTPSYMVGFLSSFIADRGLADELADLIEAP